MMQRADIVKAGSSHLKRIYELECECIAGGWSEKALEEALGKPGSLVLAAVCYGETVGFLNGSYVMDEAELLNIAVCPQKRRLGIARMLIRTFEEELLQLGAVAIYLEVRESNIPAQVLYKKCGFERNGLRKNYYRDPSENAILMMKKL